MIENLKPTITEFQRKVSKISKELPRKEVFRDLLRDLFPDETSRKKLDKMSLGAEKKVMNIPLEHRLKTGSADSQFDNIIIEFEGDLAKKGNEAKRQLAEYLAGNYMTTQDYNFTLIATDCLNWKVYAPNPLNFKGKRRISVDDIELNEVQSFALNTNNAEDFYLFLDRFIFQEQKIKPTLENIQDDFGEFSQVFINVFRLFSEHFAEVRQNPEAQTAYEEWGKFLSIAYGKFEASESVFLVHSYLSLFSKMLAYTVLFEDDWIDDQEMTAIITGEIFRRKHIENFVEDDFFHWLAAPQTIRALRPAFRRIADQLSRYDFQNIQEDILKGVYQELIDLETRHALGEYYTPDWLCEKIVEQLDLKPHSKILDPSCGSGSFLIAATRRLRTLFPDLSAEELVAQVQGIDIHPLSVQIAKTNLLLALGKDLTRAKHPVKLGVFLANTLILPKNTVSLFAGDYHLTIDGRKIPVTTAVFDEIELFDIGVSVCDELAEDSKGQKQVSKTILENTLRRRFTKGGIEPAIIDDFYQIYLAIKNAKELGRDSIWKFILQNIYKPYFLHNQFDFVVGNPPWFTYADVKNLEYQLELRTLAVQYAVLPEKKADAPHLEIAAIFLAHCASYFLKKGGKINFVLPRAFLSANQHDNTRRGAARGFVIRQIWDLEGVQPLFRVPCCVLVAEKNDQPKGDIYTKTGIEGFSVAGKLKRHNAPLEAVRDRLNFEPTTWFYTVLSKKTAFSTQKTKKISRPNYYKDLFKQGATIVPRSFYFVENTQDWHGDPRGRLLTLQTAPAILTDAKEPWKSITMPEQRADGDFLFRTAIARNIVPFGLIDPLLVLLPIKISGKPRQIELLNHLEIRAAGFRDTANWFRKVEEHWEAHKTESSKSMSNLDRIDFQRGIISQDMNRSYLVLYTASAKDANAVIVSRAEVDLDFVVESAAYVFYPSDFDEANYVVAFLNSSVPNAMIKDFQAKGLFGERHVHKAILEIPLPKYDSSIKMHRDLAALGAACHAKIKTYLSENVDVAKYNVGRVRQEVKQVLKTELLEIDEKISKLIG